MKTKILYIVVTKSWRDKTYGNSYSSARITAIASGKTIGRIETANGDSRYCEQIALEWLREHRNSGLDHSRIHYVNHQGCLQSEVRAWGLEYKRDLGDKK